MRAGGAGGGVRARAGTAVLGALTICAATAGCRFDQTWITPHPHLERMLKQEKVLPYEKAELLPGQMAMQAPPEGTLPVEAPTGDPMVRNGYAGGHFADHVPVKVDKPMVESGRSHFDAMCAPCHGVLGDGDSVVAEKMSLRKPPNIQGNGRDDLPGKIFTTIRLGYGLMPSYANELSVEDTWAVVAYLRALGLSRSVPLHRLPDELKAKVESQ